MGILRQVAKNGLRALLPPERLLVRGRRDGISLTFDDGPHPEHTPALLDALDTYNIRATFFVVGQQASRHPELVRRVADAGHDIGNHTWTHCEPACIGARAFLDEVDRTRDLLESLTGYNCPLFRPPKGELSIGKLTGLLRRRMTIVLWNRDPRDYAMQSQVDMEQWCGAYAPSHGDIVLMHDNHPYATDAVPLFRELPRCREMTFRRVSEIVLKTTTERGAVLTGAGL